MQNVLRQSYINYLNSAKDEELEEIAKIREFYEGRQFKDVVTGERAQYISPVVEEMLKTYPFINIVKRTVQVLRERIRVSGIKSDNEQQAQLAQDWWKAEQMGAWQQYVYEAALRDKACALIVGWDGEKKQPTFTLNELWDGTGGTIEIEYGNDDEVLYVSKRWPEVDAEGDYTGRTRRTKYFSNRIERYVLSEFNTDETLLTIEELKLENPNITSNPEPWLDANGEPMGIAAVIFENVGYVSECNDAMGPQAAVNDALLDYHTSTRYHGLPLMAFEEASFPIDPSTGRAIKPKWGPGQGIALDSGKVYRVPPTDLNIIYSGAIKPWLEVTAYQKGWPVHVFNQMPPSGETLRQMESSLVVQCDERKEMFEESWKEAFRIAFKLYEINTGISFDTDIDILWKSSLGINAIYDMNVMAQKKATADLPQLVVLREMGYDEDEIAKIIEERNKEKEKSAELFRQRNIESLNGGKTTSGADDNVIDKPKQDDPATA